MSDISSNFPEGTPHGDRPSAGALATHRPKRTTFIISIRVWLVIIVLVPVAVALGLGTRIVTNQASHSETLDITRGPVGSHPLASTAPINPQGTTQVTVDFKPGDYTISTAAHGETDASLSRPSAIASASLHIGRTRAASSNSLLQP